MLTNIWGNEAFPSLGFHAGTLSGSHSAAVAMTVSEEADAGTEVRAEWRLCFRLSLYCLNLCRLKTVNQENNPTGQHANLTFRRI